ncbi:hypothetical protein Tco_0819320 [Tanacetum coccineum]|uniref:Uncharacterized protein n=1 Tax=Tanacetum coccineum TaxID=301880 RepID=A0ABQ5A758_9ASTR
METEANDPNHLVNYDYDNDIDDLGYESEVYLDEQEEEEEEENNHLNRNVVKRGITRLSKFRKEYGKPDGIKISVTFNELNRISGKHRALFSSFLGDLVREHIDILFLNPRYFDVDLTVKKLVMNRLGQLLRNFRRKLRETYILPNQNTLSKLNEVPVKYSAILKDKEWVNFVNKVKSAATKLARSKSVYQHTMGRGGYAHVKKKMIKNKEIEPDEEPPRGILWLKGSVNKDEEFQNNEIRLVGDKLVRKREVRQEEWEVELHTRSILIFLEADKHLMKELYYFKVSPVDINPIDSSADEEGGTLVVGCENDASIQKSNGLATSEKEMETRETVNSVVSKKMTRSIRKVSSRQDSQSQENVSQLLVLPQSDGKQML